MYTSDLMRSHERLCELPTAKSFNFNRLASCFGRDEQITASDISNRIEFELTNYARLK